ncbi:MAG: tRNA(Ile)-lysidine synthetase [Thermoleophilia bacterium]|nr:tRNA(Ile)-lysidine synthetase [Thermoleophilia bacterium]
MVVAATSDTIVRRVRRTLDDAGASLVGRRVLAMCSGGADSVALVALLGSLPRGAAPRSIDVLLVDFGQRDTAVELAAAAAAAGHVGARFHHRAARLDLAPGTSFEAAARDARYDIAVDLARELDADVVCTGHSASDQVEQALLSLIGVTGRTGSFDAMPVAREFAPGLQLVRPLLGTTRDQHEEACREAGLGWGIDPTNADPEYAVRNAVRHTVVPALLDVRDDAGVAIARAGRRHRELDTVTTSLAAALLHEWEPDDPGRIDVRRLAACDPATRRELLAAWLRRAQLGRAVTERSIVAIDHLALLPGRAACSRADLAGGTCVRRDGYHLTITYLPDTEGPTP